MTSVATQHKSAESAALIAECRVAAVLILHVHEAKSKFMAQNRGAARHVSDGVRTAGHIATLACGPGHGDHLAPDTEPTCTHA